MSESRRAEFFASGTDHIAHILSELRRQFDPGFAPRTALDFGCGVGRLVIPLARIAGRVTGVDISPSMIEEARKNCEQRGLHNVTFVKSDDGLSRLQGQFDLIHSDIVMPHIAWSRGRKIIQALSDHVAPHGCLALQMLTACNSAAFTRALVRLRYVFPPANWARNLIRMRPMFEPAMQLHVYDLDVVRRDLTQLGFAVTHTTNEIPGFQSTWVYAQRSARQGQG